MAKEIAYLLVPYEQVKDKFPYATVLDDGRTVLPLAKATELIGVTGIEIKGSHDVEMLVAQIGMNDNNEEEEVPDEVSDEVPAESEEDVEAEEDNEPKEEEEET